MIVNLREIEKIRPLRLGLIGYNTTLTLSGIKDFANNNREDVESLSPNGRHLRLKDGTEIIALLENEISLRGHDLDQLILYDDNRWEIKSHRYKFIIWILENLMYRSCVTDEFKILEYEDVR